MISAYLKVHKSYVAGIPKRYAVFLVSKYCLVQMLGRWFFNGCVSQSNISHWKRQIVEHKNMDGVSGPGGKLAQLKAQVLHNDTLGWESWHNICGALVMTWVALMWTFGPHLSGVFCTATGKIILQLLRTIFDLAWKPRIRNSKSWIILLQEKRYYGSKSDIFYSILFFREKASQISPRCF